MFKKDDLRLGIVLGFLAPVIGMLIYYFIQFREVSFNDFMSLILTYKKLLTGVVSISLVANAVVFTIYINARKDKTAKGIFIATCIYAILALVWKLI